MNNMSNLAKGVIIGDGGLATFLEIGRNKCCGTGLFDLTTDSGYRKLNTINNFPRTASYYSTLNKLSENPIQYKRYLAGNLVSAYNVDGLDIGWAYTTDINTHRFNLGYASSADFDNFQNLLRERYNGKLGLDGKAKINSVIKEKFNLDNLNNKVLPDTDLFKLLDFSLPLKSDNELLYFDSKNTLLDNNDLEIKNKYNYTKPYKIGFNYNRLLYKVQEQEIKEYKNISIAPSFDDTRDAFIKEYSENNVEGDFPISASSLYDYTQKLFTNGKIKTMVNRENTNEVTRGRNLKNNGEYCRIWTARKQYSKIENLIRPQIGGKNYQEIQKSLSDDIRPHNGQERLYNNSVLLDSGFVKITPTEKSTQNNIKNYMFSIENLAWKDDNQKLTQEQKGPGGGRIMWFPPYNLKFSENINVNWNGNSFIGRGEQIYTYTNTERSGTLDFTLLIDHPSILNEWRGRGDIADENNENENKLLRFFAGCEMLDNKIQNDSKSNENKSSVHTSNLEPAPASDTIKKLFIIFFPNAFSGQDYQDVDEALLKLYPYEMDSSKTVITAIDNKYSASPSENINSFSLNSLKDYVSGISYFNDFKKSDDIFNLEDLITVGFEKKLNLKKILTIDVLYNNEKIFDISSSGNYFNDDSENYFKFNDNIIEEDDEKKYGYLKLIDFEYNTSKDYINDFIFENEKDEIIKVSYGNQPIARLIRQEENNEVDYYYLDEDIDDEDIKLYFEVNGDEVIPIDILDWLNLKFKFRVLCKGIYDVKEVIEKYELDENKLGINLTSHELSQVTYYGGTSSHGNITINTNLANYRMFALNKILNKINISLQGVSFNNILSTNSSNISNLGINDLDAKLNRYGAAVLEYRFKNNSPKHENNVANITFNDKNTVSSGSTTYTTDRVTVTDSSKYEFGNEYLYFQEIEKQDDIVSKILKRVRHFDPAFHSLTPEGFNSRLTFLHQCTRQGPTNTVNSGKFNSDSDSFLKYAGNLAFGRAPYCVLRIGDFFNTKIIIDSISINYDNGGGTQWDLNPEGAGVQPMFANVSLNFKFLGGQDISGPIEKLQNAVSSNYYANASVYDKNADYNNKLN